MKHRFGPSLYFANDKVIFDSLNQHSVGVDLIRELLSERGIIVSPSTPKEDLAKYFSRLTADYFDHDSIAIKLGRVAKQERITSSELMGSIKDSDVLASLNALKSKLEVEGDQVTISVNKNQIIALISYDHIDYTRIDLRQVEPRDAIIEFTKEAEGVYVVRSTQNTDIDPVVESVVASLKASADGDLSRSRINMESIADPIARTQFFESLMKDIDGYIFSTVTEAYCFKPKLSELGGDDDDASEPEELESSPYVEKVGLRGEGVNRSFVIKDLYKKGYYIVKVVWRARLKDKIDSDIFELEAQFSRPDSCTGFSYRVKSVILVDEGKTTSKKRSAKIEERDSLFRLIELAAKRALAPKLA
jgi:hypothetical protein